MALAAPAIAAPVRVFVVNPRVELRYADTYASYRDKMFALKDRGIVEERMEGAKSVFRFRSALMEWFVIQDLQDAKDEKELAERQKILFGLSNKQLEKVKGAMSLIWKNKDAVTAMVKWTGQLAGAFSKGFTGA